MLIDISKLHIQNLELLVIENYLRIEKSLVIRFTILSYIWCIVYVESGIELKYVLFSSLTFPSLPFCFSRNKCFVKNCNKGVGKGNIFECFMNL